MGVIYKLKPEIKNWLLERKRTNPVLSCRSLVSLLEEEFKIKVSKSSVNYLVKEAGLSMPIGRRQKKRRRQAPAAVQPQPEPTIETPLQLPAPTQPEPTIETPIEPQLETPPQPQPEPPQETPAPTQPEAPAETPVPPETPAPIPQELPTQTPLQIPDEILQKMLSSGIVLLKAADYLIGGSYLIQETIKKHLNLRDKNLLDKIECLIYAPLLGISEELFKTYLNELQEAELIVQEILRVLSGVLTEVRCLKILLADGDALYLDGQFHTIWSVPNIPYDFVNTIYNIKNYITKSFYKDDPVTLFMAPGYDTPTLELFNFILSFGGRMKNITRLSIDDNKSQELESAPLGQNKKHSFVLGLWPWQFVEYRRVKKIGDFKPFYFQAQGKNFYLADIEIELSWPNRHESITFSGCALKTSLAEKTRLIIISNLAEELAKPEYLANTYLSRWPNLEEAFQDFSHKVELLTYTADSQGFFSAEKLNLNQDTSGIKQLLSWYLGVLDLYVKWHFLPSEYAGKDFLALKEEFYGLKVVFQPQKEHALATFQPPSGFRSLNALEYACRRLNEREIILTDGKRLWFSP